MQKKQKERGLWYLSYSILTMNSLPDAFFWLPFEVKNTHVRRIKREIMIRRGGGKLRETDDIPPPYQLMSLLKKGGCCRKGGGREWRRRVITKFPRAVSVFAVPEEA